MKVSDVLRQCWRELKDKTDGTGEWTTRQMVDWINDGLRLIWSKAVDQAPSLVNRRTAITIPAFAGSFELDFVPLRISRIRIIDGSFLLACGPDDLPDIAQPGTPRYYAMEGVNTLLVAPAAKHEMQASVNYAKAADTLLYDPSQNIDSVIPLPDDFAVYLKFYVMVRAYNREMEQPQIESMFMNEHENDLLYLFESRYPTLLTADISYGMCH